MENTETDTSSDEFKVVEMLGVDTRVGIDLKSVIVVGRVLEQTVERVKHFVRQQEEEFTVDQHNTVVFQQGHTEKDPRNPNRPRPQT